MVTGGTVRGEIVWDQHVPTVMFKMDNQQDATVWHRELCSMYVAAWMGGTFGGEMDTCVCMTESLLLSPESITTLLTGYTSIQNKTFQKKY